MLAEVEAELQRAGESSHGMGGGQLRGLPYGAINQQLPRQPS